VRGIERAKPDFGMPFPDVVGTSARNTSTASERVHREKVPDTGTI